MALGFRAIFVPFLIKKRHFSQVFVPHILIFKKLHLLLLPKMEVQAENGLKITNLHIIRYLPTCWLYLLECYTIDNQRCTHTASENLYLFYCTTYSRSIYIIAYFKRFKNKYNQTTCEIGKIAGKCHTYSHTG